jgi:hypothetical protein
MTALLENGNEEKVVRRGTPSAAMYVSTSLEQWITNEPAFFARDLQIDDTAYRRLDPEYYAWLRSKMTIAKSAVAAGKLSASQFDDLRARFNAMQDWATANFGEPRLFEAIRTLDARRYAPPVAEPWTELRPWPVATPSGNDKGFFTQPVSDQALECVNAIRERALALGWTHEALYQARGRLRFPFGGDYGLVCFLDADDRIGTVAADSIEIIGPPPQGFRSHFYNPNFEQPRKRHRA